jgi:hypothetical protein
VFGLYGREIQLVWALAALAGGVAILVRRERAPLLIAPGAIALAVATLLVEKEFSIRAPYAYTPFLTAASVAALAAVLGWATLGWAVADTDWPHALPPRERGLIAALGLIAAFLWGRAELAEAWSGDISTFLLIIYFAATGVAAIFVGRRRGLLDLRRVGLGLAIYGALKAVVQAYELGAVGLRVGSFLLVGVFLLAVAYWYSGARSAAPE